MYQCAETTRIARGRGIRDPNTRHDSVYRLWSRAFIGVPWPKNAAGIALAPSTSGPPTPVTGTPLPELEPTGTHPHAPPHQDRSCVLRFARQAANVTRDRRLLRRPRKRTPRLRRHLQAALPTNRSPQRQRARETTTAPETSSSRCQTPDWRRSSRRAGRLPNARSQGLASSLLDKGRRGGVC